MTGYRVDPERVAWRVLDDEAVLIHLQNSDYFGLNAAGAWVWSRLAEHPRTAEQVAGLLAVQCGIRAEQASADVATFLEQLRRADLLEAEPVESGAAARTEAPVAGDGCAPYEPPQLVKFGDLDTLILSAE